jgi:WD40 repeat protein
MTDRNRYCQHRMHSKSSWQYVHVRNTHESRRFWWSAVVAFGLLSALFTRAATRTPHHVYAQDSGFQPGFVSDIAFSPNNAILAVASSDSPILLWDAHTHSAMTQLSTDAHIYAIAFSPDSSLLAGAGAQALVVWSLNNMRVIQSLSLPYLHEGYGTPNASQIAFSPNGKLLAVGMCETIDVYDVDTWTLRYQLDETPQCTYRMAFSPNSEILASVGNYGTISVWNMSDMSHLAVLSDGLSPATPLDNVFILRDDTTLVTEGFAKVDYWNIRTQRLTMSYTLALRPSIMALSPDESTFGAGTLDENGFSVFLADTSTGRIRQQAHGMAGAVVSVIFSPDGSVMASAGGYDRTVRLWSVSALNQIIRFGRPLVPVTALAFNPAGDQLAAGGGATVQLYALDSPESIAELSGCGGIVTGVAFRPDGQQIVASCNDRTVRLWNTVTGSADGTLKGHTNPVQTVAFSPDGSVFASGGYDGSIILWNDLTQRPIATLTDTGQWVISLAFRPNGGMLAAAQRDGIVDLWNADGSGLIKAIPRQYGGVDALPIAWSPDGHVLAIGSSDGTIQLWNVDSLQLVTDIVNPHGAVVAIAYSPKGDMVASADRGGHISLWNAISGELLSTFGDGVTNTTLALAFSPNGSILASAGGDGAVQLWVID